MNVKKPKRGRGIAALYYLASGVIFVLGLFLAGVLFNWKPTSIPTLCFMFLFVWPACSALFYKARRLAHPTVPSVITRDSRRPILLLRSFADDGKRFGFKTTLSANTQEGELAEHLRKLGPVIAIGKPGEELTEIGATRIYVPHDQWQAVVLQLLEWCRCAVIRTGSHTQGLVWEMTTAREVLPPEKLVVELPLSAAEATDYSGDSSSASYTAFCRTMRESMGVQMPSAVKGYRFVAFDTEWRPRPVKPADFEPYSFIRRFSWKNIPAFLLQDHPTTRWDNLVEYFRERTDEREAASEMKEFLAPFA
jgi:hypothetical protein